jgi:hypothetical protein
MMESPVFTPPPTGTACTATPALAPVLVTPVQVSPAAAPVPGASPVAFSASITTTPPLSRKGTVETTAAEIRRDTSGSP